MALKVGRLGSPREDQEGLLIGTVRRPPRGVKKEDYASKNFYNARFPNLSPSETLMKKTPHPGDEKSWKAFKRKFLAEMKASEASKDLDLLVALSHSM